MVWADASRRCLRGNSSSSLELRTVIQDGCLAVGLVIGRVPEWTGRMWIVLRPCLRGFVVMWA
jgi:hypothetical protein